MAFQHGASPLAFSGQLQALIITGVNFYNFAATAGSGHEIVLEAGPAASPSRT